MVLWNADTEGASLFQERSRVSLIYALKTIKNLSKSVGGSEVPLGNAEPSAHSNSYRYQ